MNKDFLINLAEELRLLESIVSYDKNMSTHVAEAGLKLYETPRKIDSASLDYCEETAKIKMDLVQTNLARLIKEAACTTEIETKARKIKTSIAKEIGMQLVTD